MTNQPNDFWSSDLSTALAVAVFAFVVLGVCAFLYKDHIMAWMQRGKNIVENPSMELSTSGYGTEHRYGNQFEIVSSRKVRPEFPAIERRLRRTWIGQEPPDQVFFQSVTVDDPEEEDEDVEQVMEKPNLEIVPVEHGMEQLPVPQVSGVQLAKLELELVPAPPSSPRRSDLRFSVGRSEGQHVYFYLGHTLITRMTGGGKSNNLAILIGQALRAGAEVWYINCAYSPVDEDGLDIDPLIQRCAQVAIDPSGIAQLIMLKRAKRLIDERIRQSQVERIGAWSPVIIVVEELKSLQERMRLLKSEGIDAYKNAYEQIGGLISVIVSSGRRYNVNFWGASNDAQAQTTGIHDGTFCNVEVRLFHPSLDEHSLKKLYPASMRGKQRRHQPPPITSSNQWYLVAKDRDVEQLWAVDVPKITNEDIAKYVDGIPVVQRGKPEPPSEPLVDAWMQEQKPIRSEAPVVVADVEEESPAIPEPVEMKPVLWTPDHIKTAAWLSMPNERRSQRALAEYLYGSSDGRYNTRAGVILEQVRSVIGTERVEPTEKPE